MKAAKGLVCLKIPIYGRRGLIRVRGRRGERVVSIRKTNRIERDFHQEGAYLRVYSLRSSHGECPRNNSPVEGWGKKP